MLRSRGVAAPKLRSWRARPYRSAVIVELIEQRWPGSGFAGSAEPVGLDGEHRDDVVLAAACVGKVVPAIAELETRAIAPALHDVRTKRLAGDALDDIAQLARLRLLVGPPPAITGYQGRGSLAAFVRTLVFRIAIDQRRGIREVADDGTAGLIDQLGTDPELALMRERYAGDLGEALTTAWRALAAHDRFVLGLELQQRLGIDEIARVYAVHRTNATRRLASARAALVAGVRTALREKLGISDSTLDSILRLLTTSTRWSALPAFVEP